MATKTDKQQERLPPWRIAVDRDGDIVVTDGLLALIYPDHILALKALANCSERWPHGTREGSPGQLKRAYADGHAKGAILGLAVGILAGCIVSLGAAMLGHAWRGL